MQIYDSFEKLEHSEIERFELEQKINLPKQYIDFLLKSNGGRTKLKVFNYKLNEEERRGIIEWFFGIHSGHRSSLEYHLQMYKGRIPKDLIPIAHDPGGNLICLSLSDGTVHFWDHNYEVDEGEVPDYQNVYFVANSLNEFFNSLRDFD